QKRTTPISRDSPCAVAFPSGNMAARDSRSRRNTMQLSKKTISVYALILFFSAVTFAQAPRGITPEDYYSFEFISDPNISPDGKLVAYVVTKIDRAQNRRNASIWMVATDASRAPWQFTTSPQSSNSPRWSSDGKSLAFLSSRPETTATASTTATPVEQPRNQVYLLSMNGGEARRITNLKNGVSTFRWSPDASRFVVISRVGPGDNRADNKDRSDVRHYKNSSYK